MACLLGPLKWQCHFNSLLDHCQPSAGILVHVGALLGGRHVLRAPVWGHTPVAPSILISTACIEGCLVY